MSKVELIKKWRIMLNSINYSTYNQDIENVDEHTLELMISINEALLNSAFKTFNKKYHIVDIADHFGVTTVTVRDWLSHYELDAGDTIKDLPRTVIDETVFNKLKELKS